MIHHIHRLRNKPEHVRKNIAGAAAGALTALVAVGWVAATVAGGTLSVKPTSLAASDSAPAAAPDNGSVFSQLLGAVGAAGSGSTAPALKIVDDSSASVAPVAATTSAGQQTVIPF
jgi:hypothetical protein